MTNVSTLLPSVELRIIEASNSFLSCNFPVRGYPGAGVED